MITVNNLLNGDTFLTGTDGDRHTMLVASTDEQALATLQTQIANIYISRNIYTC